ncbi:MULTISPECIES: carbon storage regulator [unclassified Schlesneria]|uniref:carbon storage regulator n=1 Tax=Schlesneria TaxID=656899 RepID=UPI002F1BDC94
MLVLTRKLDQVIKLGDDITIKVVRMSNGSVQLGVEAPRSLKIMRAECLERSLAHSPEQKVA